MVRLKTPLLSMDAHGSIGDALTFQSSTRRKFAREKPHLPYSLTLNQQYQRWLYEDYCAYWHTLTTTQKNVYRDGGHRFHRTAFQHFMSVMLATLPDILAMFRCDYISAGLVRDFSKYSNNGTVVGASIDDGLIDRALHYDGVNDRVNFGNPSHLLLVNDFTIESLIRWDVAQNVLVIPWGSGHDGVSGLVLQLNVAALNTHYGIGGALQSLGWTIDPRDGLWHHFCFRKSSTLGAFNFLDGALDTSNAAHTGDIDFLPAWNWYLGRGVAARYFTGEQDHFIIWDRCLSDADILRHAGRRYQS